MQSLTTIASDLGIPLGDESSSRRIRDRVKAELEGWGDLWLLVFDNFDQPQEFDDVQDWFPIGEFSAVEVVLCRC